MPCMSSPSSERGRRTCRNCQSCILSCNLPSCPWCVCDYHQPWSNTMAYNLCPQFHASCTHYKIFHQSWMVSCTSFLFWDLRQLSTYLQKECFRCIILKEHGMWLQKISNNSLCWAIGKNEFHMEFNWPQNSQIFLQNRLFDWVPPPASSEPPAFPSPVPSEEVVVGFVEVSPISRAVFGCFEGKQSNHWLP